MNLKTSVGGLFEVIPRYLNGKQRNITINLNQDRCRSRDSNQALPNIN
jgi:hypothetical protein